MFEELPLEEKLLGTAQATENRMLLPQTVGNGWMKQEGIFLIDWDSKGSMQAVRQRGPAAKRMRIQGWL